jgi:predicted  nucleic acid-binding Zn-ribbon protein
MGPALSRSIRVKLTVEHGRSGLQETLLQLIETEKFDGEIDMLDAQLSMFPGEIALVASEIVAVEQRIADARRLLETEELEERRLESQMRVQEDLIVKLNHQTGQVSSNQAYTALQHEIDAAEAAKTEFETHALEHMEAIDLAKTTLSDAQAELADLQQAGPERIKQIETRREGAEAEREKLVGSRDGECEGIDAKVIKLYQATRKKKRPAIVVLKGDACPHCKVVLPRMRVSEVLRLEDVFTCTNCRRILAPAKIYPDTD